MTPSEDDGPFDVAVIGAGPAGLAAAGSAVAAGARVALVDMAPRPGGQYWRHRDADDGARHHAWPAFLTAAGSRGRGARGRVAHVVRRPPGLARGAHGRRLRDPRARRRRWRRSCARGRSSSRPAPTTASCRSRAGPCPASTPRAPPRRCSRATGCWWARGSPSRGPARSSCPSRRGWPRQVPRSSACSRPGGRPRFAAAPAHDPPQRVQARGRGRLPAGAAHGTGCRTGCGPR